MFGVLQIFEFQYWIIRTEVEMRRENRLKVVKQILIIKIKATPSCKRKKTSMFTRSLFA